ncbi:MAG: hypothetical protein PHS62_05145, partial [Patescibacteria group bacterium]|nr:hypothetical protein [Patescibacteria group bacterium]
NITKGLKDITRELSAFAAQIKTLTKKKVDTANMQELLNTLKAQVAEVKDLINNKADAEEIAAKVEEAFDTRQELQDALQEHDMINTAPKVSTGSNYNVKVNLPEAFMKTENTGDNGEATGSQNPTSGGSSAPTKQ